MTQVAQARLDGDCDNDKAVIAETMKLIRNSSYGKLITNKEKHHNIVYVNESEIGTEIMDKHFYNLTELSDSYYEVEKTKKKINLDLPINLGVFILNNAKLRMLEFYYDFFYYYLPHEDFEILEMDMDSNYLRITAENVEDLNKPELRQDFERNKHNWFVTPLAPQGKHTPGLFKVEFKGNKMIGLCSKSYCTELFVTENSPTQVKVSMKGINKGQFKSTSRPPNKIFEPVTNVSAPKMRVW